MRGRKGLEGGGGGAVRPPETLTRSERAAWRVQNIFRRWTVFIVLNFASLAWLVFGNDTARVWWNYTYSDLAVDVEFVTALALVSLARRDHQAISDIEMTTKRIERIEEHVLGIVDHLRGEQEAVE